MTYARLEFVDDVASELRFVARGDSMNDLFASAAEALLRASVDGSRRLRGDVVRSVDLAEPDLELLLLRFLNELIYLRDAQDVLLRARAVRVELTPEGARLSAELAGTRMDSVRDRMLAEVNAATPYQLSIEREGEGCRATVTLDV